VNSHRGGRAWPTETAGEAHVIGPNRTTCSTGDQPTYSNGYMPKGNAGTGATSAPFRPGKARTNRTGEGGGGY
jgi:hypothetical protein